MFGYDDPMRRCHVLLVLCLFTILVESAGCAHREAPEVLVTNIAPLESTAFEQRLQVDLRVKNPNDYDVQVTGVDFRLDLNGKRFARGLGNKEFVIPRLSDAAVSLETSTSMLDVVRQILGLRNSHDVTYGISGVLYTTRGRLPFEHAGYLVEPGELSGILSP
jgi:LEA14-like dessication related protein